MDDLLSVALSEAGLDEFLVKPSSPQPTAKAAEPAAVIEADGCASQASCSPTESENPRSSSGTPCSVPAAPESTHELTDNSFQVSIATSYTTTAKENKCITAPSKRISEVASVPGRSVVQIAPQQKRSAGSPIIVAKHPHATPTILRTRRATVAYGAPQIRTDEIEMVREPVEFSPLYRSVNDGRRYSGTVGYRTVGVRPVAQPSRGTQRIVVVRRATPYGGTVLVRRPQELGPVRGSPSSTRTVVLRQTSGPVTRTLRTTTITRQQHALNSRAASPVFLQRRSSTNSARAGAVLTHSSVHDETGHQYIASSSPPLSASVPCQPRIIRSASTPRGPQLTSSQVLTVTPSTSRNSPTIRVPMVRVRSSSMVNEYGAARSISGISPTVKQLPHKRELNDLREVQTRSIPTRPLSNVPRLTNVDGRPRQPIRSQEIIHQNTYGNIRRGELSANVTTSLPNKCSVPISEVKKEVNVIEIKPTVEPKKSKVQERKDVVKQERKTARDEMKAALQAGVTRSHQEIEDEEENLGYAETYADYCPAKLRSGLSHPDCVVETASLSSVAPPDIHYNLAIPEELIDTGAISAVQLEAVVYACQAHETRLPSGERTGYLIGDGAGVGKGRAVACIIFENYLLGRKRSLWLSVSSDLKYDAERDLRDIGAKNIKVHALNKFKYAKISGKENGSVKKGCLFATYSSLIGECRTAKSKYRTRLKQIIQWCGQDFEGVIVLDECHRAKNLVPTAGSKPTKTGRMVMELQKALPNARIVYASATGATEPRNMAYMTRLGLWGEGQAFPEFADFINAVEKRGVGAMEIVAMDMKQRGLYLARQLSFRGVSFRVEEVPLSAEFVEIYDDSVKLWMECRRQFQAALNALSEHGRGQGKQLWGQFWAAHQRFFKYLCIGAKVEACVKIARDAVKANKCVVIGLQSTGEARTLEVLDDTGGELTDFVSTAKAVLTGLIDKHFPTSGKNSGGDIFSNFDRMFNEFDRPAKRKRISLGYSAVDSIARSYSSNQLCVAAKKPRCEEGEKREGSDSENTDNSDEEASADSNESETDQEDGSEEDEESEDGAIEGDEEAWLKRLLDEAKSSDEESSGEQSEADQSLSEESADGTQETESVSQADDDFNPFACDFTQEDPWAAKQQIISDSPKKKKAKNKKKKKKKKDSKTKEIEVPTRKTALESEAMMDTADAFISSSRIFDEAGEDPLVGGSMIKAELLAAAERLGTRLPPNTLDQLIDELGGPEYVAEMTGRKGRVVSREDGEIEYELRHAGADVPLELMNMDEKDKFMKGTKLIAVISEAASSGISLQSDRRAPNRRRRVHITLELPWSADKAIQQFGRTHRSNQVSAPEYIFLISELAGEKRFASIVAKRLESLGALTHGDRRATESRDLSQFNLDTRYGRAALDVLLRTVTGSLNPPLIPTPSDYKPGNFLADMARYMEGVGLLSSENGVFTIERESATIPKFLNRILGLPVHAQNALFQYFSDIVSELVAQAKHDGTYDMGIMDLGMGGDEARKLETRVFLGRVDRGSFRVEMHKIGVERGVTWEDAYAIWKDHHEDQDGFYLSVVGANGKQAAALVYGIGKKRLDTGARLFCVTRPSTGRSPKLETHAELAKRFQPATPEETEKVWKDQYEGSNVMCQHNYFHGRCRSEAQGVYCETGRRTRTYFVLSGSVLSVWPVVEEVLSGGMSAREIRKTQRMQIIRVRTQQDLKIVGLLVLPQYVRTLVARLEEHCGRCFVEAKSTATL